MTEATCSRHWLSRPHNGQRLVDMKRQLDLHGNVVVRFRPTSMDALSAWGEPQTWSQLSYENDRAQEGPQVRTARRCLQTLAVRALPAYLFTCKSASSLSSKERCLEAESDNSLRHKDVAERLGVDPMAVNNWERQYTEPTARLVRRITPFLDTP